MILKDIETGKFYYALKETVRTVGISAGDVIYTERFNLVELNRKGKKQIIRQLHKEIKSCKEESNKMVSAIELSDKNRLEAAYLITKIKDL